MYINSIVDLCNSKIAVWRISDHPDTALCVGTAGKLSERYGGRLEGSVLHSDAGATYTSFSYRECLESFGVMQSMGAKATCYDNAALESVNGIIKTEALYAKLGKSKVKEPRVPREEILSQVTSFIRYYNEERPKKRLGGLPQCIAIISLSILSGCPSQASVIQRGCARCYSMVLCYPLPWSTMIGWTAASCSLPTESGGSLPDSTLRWRRR